LSSAQLTACLRDLAGHFKTDILSGSEVSFSLVPYENRLKKPKTNNHILKTFWIAWKCQTFVYMLIFGLVVKTINENK
jgi:hypothetical protein